MNERYDTCHIFSKGAGGCDCEPNKLMLARYYHKILDGHLKNYEVEHTKVRLRKILEKEPRSFRHKLAFGYTFGYTHKIRRAINHHKKRNRGLTKCSKISIYGKYLNGGPNSKQ
jgi:hypothetical protein